MTDGDLPWIWLAAATLHQLCCFVCYCVSYAVHDIVSGPTAPITCSEYSFSCSCLNLCIICKQFTNVYCNQTTSCNLARSQTIASAVDKRNCVLLHSELRAFHTLYICFSTSRIRNNQSINFVADAFYLKQVPEIVLTHRCQARLPT